jgi:predicted ATPase
MKTNNWYVITGGPSSGKTTLIDELSKLGHKTIPEAARVVIDEAIKKGISVEALRADEKKFQDEVMRLKGEIEGSYDKNVATFFDRGIHDTLAYFRFYGFEIDDWIKDLMDGSRYQKVFLLEPLPTFKEDYARTEDHDFAKKLHKLIHDAYTEFEMEPIHVPAMSLEERLKFILDKVKVGQAA